jgi:hypothetical protein
MADFGACDQAIRRTTIVNSAQRLAGEDGE